MMSRGYHEIALGEIRTYMGLGTEGSTECKCIESTDLEEPLAVVQRCRRQETVLSDPTAGYLKHQLADPRGRVSVVVRDPNGKTAATAMVGVVEVLTKEGPENYATIEGIFIPEATPPILRSLMHFASSRWAERVTSPVITVPNAPGIDSAILRAAGLRATPASFLGYLFFNEPTDLFPNGAVTNLDII
jgi:hypothetical protein